MIRNEFASCFTLHASRSIFKPAACSLWRATVCTILFLSAVRISCFAQDNNKLVTLSKQIIESKNNEELYASFEELKDLYFQENKYSELVEFLKSLVRQKEALGPFVDYYTALTRYNQLKYLEETQNWNEYFSEGNNYREQLTVAIQKAIDSTNPNGALNIYSQFLLWQFHKDQQDAFAESSLTDLMNAVLEYAKEAKDLKPIKEAAEKLLAYEEKGKSKELYKIYVNKLIGLAKEDKELESIAVGLYKEGNLELSGRLYDVYIERIAKTYPKEKLIPVLISIAGDFSHKDEGQKDAAYAEKIFKKIEEAGTRDAFDEELTYLRAYNAEKMKDYPKSKDFYLDLIQRYPQTKYADEAYFKAGIISIYILREIKTGRDYFEKLALRLSHSINSGLTLSEQSESKAKGRSVPMVSVVEPLAQEAALSPQTISSLYQLGLLSQWENDFVKAKDYYNRLVEKAGNDFTETAALAQERLEEITGSKPIEYKLKTFIDISLKEENPAFTPLETIGKQEKDKMSLTGFTAGLADLNSSRHRLKKDESADISCTPYTVESGCMRVEIQYLWSGDLGSAKPPLENSEFNTTYAQRGSKVINLVVVSPGGVLDRSIEIVDVY